jgi:hypothetical protein
MRMIDDRTDEPGTRSDRRAHPRVPCTTPLDAEHSGPDGHVQTSAMLAENLSEGGLCITSSEFLPLGSHLLVSLELDDDAEPLRAVCVVVRIETLPHQDRWSLGLMFHDLSHGAQSRIRNYLGLDFAGYSA